MIPTANLRLGLVGLGGHVRDSLLPNLLVHPQLEIVAWADPFVDAGLIPSVLGKKRCDSWHEVLASRPDAVVVAGPPSLHTEVAHACVEARIAVLVEKPLAQSVEEARGIARASERSGVLVEPGLNFAHSFAARRVYQQIQAGGGLELLSIAYVAKGAIEARWGLSRAQSLLLAHGSHAVDLALLWSGHGLPSVKARWLRQSAAFARLDFEDGPMVNIEIASGAPRFHLEYRAMLADGSVLLGKGLQEVRRLGPEGREERRGQSWRSSLIDSRGTAFGYSVEIDRFVEAVLTDKRKSTTLDRAVSGLIVLDHILSALE